MKADDATGEDAGAHYTRVTGAYPLSTAPEILCVQYLVVQRKKDLVTSLCIEWP